VRVSVEAAAEEQLREKRPSSPSRSWARRPPMIDGARIARFGAPSSAPKGSARRDSTTSSRSGRTNSSVRSCAWKARTPSSKCTRTTGPNGWRRGALHESAALGPLGPRSHRHHLRRHPTSAGSLFKATRAFLEPGHPRRSLDLSKKWAFEPSSDLVEALAKGEKVRAAPGLVLGEVRRANWSPARSWCPPTYAARKSSASRRRASLPCWRRWPGLKRAGKFP
jgi:hypothetical protein